MIVDGHLLMAFDGHRPAVGRPAQRVELRVAAASSVVTTGAVSGPTDQHQITLARRVLAATSVFPSGERSGSTIRASDVSRLIHRRAAQRMVAVWPALRPNLQLTKLPALAQGRSSIPGNA
jgi:hypothetical protein